MRYWYFKVLTTITMVLGLWACSNGSGSGSSSTPPSPIIPSSYSPVTFDNVATVPVFASTSTRTLVYVHNNSNSKITGIKYTGETDAISKVFFNKIPKNLATKVDIDQFIDPTSAAQCGTIAANSSCALIINTPALDATSHDASGVLSLSCSYGGKNYQNSQIVNMSLVDDISKEGVYFSSTSELYSNYQKAYATIYIYGSGEGKSYSVDSITPSDSFLNITQNNPSKSIIPSGFIQAIEIEVPQANLPYSTDLTLYSSLLNSSIVSKSVNQSDYSLKSGNNYMSTAVINVSGFISGPLLIASTPPVYNTATGAGAGSYYILNSGSATATITGITYSGGLSSSTGSDQCSANATLGPGDTCSVYFQVPSSYNPESGINNGTIGVAYNTGSINTPIFWYNSLGGALVSMTPGGTLNISQGSSESVTITVKNIGGYSLSVGSINVTSMINPGPTVSIINNQCTGNSLAIGATCTFAVLAADTGLAGGNLLIGFNATYANSVSSTNPYARVYVLPFLVTSTEPNLVIGTANQLGIYGNGDSESAITVVVTNKGAGPATLTGTTLNPILPYLTVNNGCNSGSVSGNGGTCSAIFTLGPWESDNQVTGSDSWSITYSGVNGTYNYEVNTFINYIINPPSFVVTNFVATGSTNNITGGSSATPFAFNGNTTTQSYTITYQNNTGGVATIEGIQDNISNVAWVRATSGSNLCTVGQPVAAGGVCNIVYNNNLANIPAATAVATYTENLGAPTLILDLGANTTFSTTPQIGINNIGSTIYANSNQAVLTNIATQLNGTVSIKQSIAWPGGSNYSPITLTTMMEDYTAGSWDTLAPCSASSASGIITQTCTSVSIPTSSTLTNFYPTNPALINPDTTIYLHILFNMSTGGQIVAMNTNYIMLPVGNF